MRYQHKWQDIPWSDVPREGQENLEATIHRSIELGINHIETARHYGSSEMQLGPVLKKIPRENLVLQTKVPPYATAREFLDTFETSMRYLQTDYVDLLSLHGINNSQLLDWSLKKNGCLAAIRQLQREGRVRFVGFSTHASTDIIVQAIRSGEFDYVNLHWYFVNDLNWPAVAEAAARDMGVFIISPNDKGGKLYLELPKLRKLCAPLTPMQFNDLYCLARPEVHTLSLGAARPSDYDEHISALPYYDLAAETTAPVEKRLRQEMEAVLGAEWCARWPEGVPDFTQVPEQLNILEILRLYTYAKPLELIEWAKFRYNMLGAADHWFPGEHSAKLDRKGVRQALDRSPFADRIVDVLEEAHALFYDAPVKRLSQS
jgi:predicted aldo/keto reductase-like oxidoreductase